MFVQSNTVGSIKAYFNTKLSDLFTESELKLIVKELTIKRFNISSSDYLSFSESLLSESDLLFYRDALKRLQNEEPFQYILGETWFYDLNLKIDSRALIPRPETEELVEWVSSDLKGVPNQTIMDLCSGSGCVALALKNNLKDASVIASELSDGALDLIAENAERTKLNVEIVAMDVLKEEAYSNLAPDSFDCWVSNPPYIPTKEKALMAANVLEHEPEMALFVEDNDPLIFYREIAQQALQYLKPDGALYYEINEHLGEATRQLLEEIGFVNIELRKDLQGRDRMMKALKVSSRHEPE